MAQNTNNQELKQLAIRTLAEGREEISAEVHRVREQLSPVRMLQRVVDHHAGLTVALAVAAGLIPALLIFRGRRYPDRLPPPLTISVAKPPRKSMLGALVLGGLGMLAKFVTPSLIKSIILPHVVDFIAKKHPETATRSPDGFEPARRV